MTSTSPFKKKQLYLGYDTTEFNQTHQYDATGADNKSLTPADLENIGLVTFHKM